MSCAILIINWNSWGLLKQCLVAINKQTYQDFKIFVADNASSQPAPAEITKLLSDVNFIQNDCNFGFAKANNHLLKLVKDTKWVIFLNPDAFPEQNWLEEMMKYANQYANYSCFSSRLVMEENPGKLDGDGDIYHISGLAWRQRHGKAIPGNSTPKEIFSPCAAAAMYRTDVLLESGGFDEDFFCYFEDVDLGFRLRLAGHKCLLVPTAVVCHIGSATTGGQQSSFSVYHGHRNLVWTYIKNMPGVLFWLLLPFHILLNIFTVGWFVFHGQGSVICRAKKDAIKGIPAMWRKRKVIQSNRVASLKDIWRVLDKRIIPWIYRY